MGKQRVKIKSDKGEVFFSDYNFKTAFEHANEYIQRNKDKINMNVFYLNNSNFGPQWILSKIIKIK